MSSNQESEPLLKPIGGGMAPPPTPPAQPGPPPLTPGNGPMLRPTAQGPSPAGFGAHNDENRAAVAGAYLDSARLQNQYRQQEGPGVLERIATGIGWRIGIRIVLAVIVAVISAIGRCMYGGHSLTGRGTKVNPAYSQPGGGPATQGNDSSSQ